MEAASRPVLEPLSDLPVEEPIDGTVPGGPMGQPVPAGDSLASRSVGASPGSRKARPTDPAADELVDPETLLGTSDSDLLLAALNEEAAAAAATRSPAPAVPSRASFVPDSEDLLGLDQLLAPEGQGEGNTTGAGASRSEERRVGKECSS